MNEKHENRVIVAVPAHEPDPPNVVRRRRIRNWAAILTVFALLAFMLLNRQGYDSKSVPDFLIGEWTSESPEYSDRYIELSAKSIVRHGRHFIRQIPDPRHRPGRGRRCRHDRSPFQGRRGPPSSGGWWSVHPVLRCTSRANRRISGRSSNDHSVRSFSGALLT